MNLLAIDTAAAVCGVVVRFGEERHCRVETMARGHAEALIPMASAVMAEAGLAFSALDAVAVSVGPGAFTGLRIGIAAARGIALATGRPCFGVPTLAALALAARPAEKGPSPALAVLDTKRGDVYAQAFAAGGAPLGAAEAVPVEHLAALLAGVEGEVVVAGDVAETAIATLHTAGIAARPAGVGAQAIVCGVAEIAIGRWRAGERPEQPPRPLYLRPPDTGPAKPAK